MKEKGGMEAIHGAGVYSAIQLPQRPQSQKLVAGLDCLGWGAGGDGKNIYSDTMYLCLEDEGSSPQATPPPPPGSLGHHQAQAKDLMANAQFTVLLHMGW